MKPFYALFFNMILNQQYFFGGQISLLSILVLITSNTSTLNKLALLILTFIKIGLDYKILDFYFLGLTYIIVYVGAISILFLFVIMITDTGKTPSNPLIKNTNNKELNRILILLLILTPFLIHFADNTADSASYIKEYFVPSYNAEFISITDIQSLGYILYLVYPIIIVLIGILLWCVLIGILRISGL